MSEIYKGTSQFVYLDLYNETADATPVLNVTKSDGTTTSITVNTGTAPTGVTQRYVGVIGMALTQDETDLTATWSLTIGGSPVTKTDVYTVATPYLSLSQVKAIWPQLSDPDAVALETNVRHMIDTYCGQTFGFANKTLTVRGQGEDFLALPQRLVELQGIKTLTTTLDITDSIVTGDGWFLKKGWTAGNIYTTSTSKYFTNVDDIWINNPAPGDPGYEQPDHGYVINAPRQTSFQTPWMKDYPFEIAGNWGWKAVPQQVAMAAQLLVNDYGCNETLYRDRYLKAVKYADTDIDFSGAAWGGTGNVRADQLLSEFVIADWTLI